MNGMRLSCLFLALSLMGCQTLSQGLGFSKPTTDVTTDPFAPTCPSTSVLADAVSVTKLRPGAQIAPVPQQNAANIMLTAEMSQAQLTCEFDAAAGTLKVDLTFAVRATRGAAAGAGDPPLDFFVALVDDAGNVIYKRTFQNPPDLAGKPGNTYTQKVSDLTLPMIKGTHPADFELLTGFQLSPAELAFNRARSAYRP